MRSNQTLPPIYTSNCLRLRELLNNPDVSLEFVLANQHFATLWGTNDPQTLDFVIKHSDELIEIGFQLKEKNPLSLKCLQILSTRNQEFRNQLFEKTNFLQFVYDYIFNLSEYPTFSQKNYFIVLPYVIFDQDLGLVSFFDHKFYTAIFENIKNECDYDFAYKLIKNPPFRSSVGNILETIGVAQKLTAHLTDNDLEFVKISTRLLIEMIKGPFSLQALNALKTSINDVIDFALERKNLETVKFIKLVSELSSDKSWFSKWKSLSSFINSTLPSFCNFVKGSPDFTQFSGACLKIVLNIVTSTKKFPKEFMDMIFYLSEKFFQLKRNDFVHCGFLDCLVLMDSYKKLNTDILDEMNLFNLIISCYKEKGVDILSSYWGHLRKISQLINKFAKKSKTIGFEDWQQIVMANNEECEKIISLRYGGSVPYNYYTHSKDSSNALFGLLAVIVVLTSAAVLIVRFN
ncbi:hypothetical protein TRFO_01247 [Tritrichomonas foetus]|uniref:Uncharacterized protein n=1 Tax=Tritrichomonas foetus TaxID=1144522 RepID=A0A1J4KBT3_9EUKA|nr:hypothetical protein TRFO_01247 [Tritrichomonas foetus]|eukprot:OHT07142.1 hypothetical protein TRFO_01247 [Tritrichomonas foetus]